MLILRIIALHVNDQIYAAFCNATQRNAEI